MKKRILKIGIYILMLLSLCQYKNVQAKIIDINKYQNKTVTNGKHLTIKWKSSKKHIKKSKVKWSTSNKKVVKIIKNSPNKKSVQVKCKKPGKAVIKVKYRGKVVGSVKLKVKSASYEYITLSVRNLGIISEYPANQYKYVSDTIVVTIDKVMNHKSTYHLTHVIVKNPYQVCNGLSYGTWGGARELPTHNSFVNHWVVGVNGSYFSYKTGQPGCAGVFIKNGKVISGKFTNGREICLDSNGRFFTPEKGLTPNELINMGVKNIWGTADPVLIQNGMITDLSKLERSKNRIDGTTLYPRTAIAMVKPCEYYLITAGDYAYEKGVSYEDMQTIFRRLGCTYARCLDGGGSSSLVFQNKLLNTPACGDERPVCDFLYFTN